MYEDKAVEEKRKLAIMGYITSLGIAAILFYLTVIGGVSYPNLLKNIGGFITGNLSGVPHGAENMLQSVLNIIAIVLMNLMVAIVSGRLFSRGGKSYNFEALRNLLRKGGYVLFLIVVLEELFARGLFLGLGTMLFKGKVAFYILFVLGNGVWSLLHLTYYEDEKERTPLRVIPQFIGGVVNTYIFVRYGLVASIMAHFLFNVILLAALKEKTPGKSTWLAIVYYGALSAFLFYVCRIIGIGMDNLSPWVNNQLVPLDSFGFFQYVSVLVLINCLVVLISNVLLFDPNETRLEMKNYIFALLPAILTYVGIVFGGNWILSWFIHDVVTRAMVLTVILSLTRGSTSGSMLAKDTLVRLPAVYFTVVSFTVLGFWFAIGFTSVLTVIELIGMYLGRKALQPE